MASFFQAYGLRRLKCCLFFFFFSLKYFVKYLHKGLSDQHCTPSFIGSDTSKKAIRCQSMDTLPFHH